MPTDQLTTLNQAMQQAIAHHQAGRLQEAAELYDAILQVRPNHPDVNHNLAVLLVKGQQPAQALPYFNAALQADPTRDQYWLSYVDALILTGNAEAAQKVLELAQKQNSKGAVVKALAGRLEACMVDLINKDRTDEALSLARKMTLCCPENGFGWNVFGGLLGKTGHSTEALQPMLKAAELLPMDAEVRANLGNVLKALGRLGEAEASYRQALQIEPDFAGAHDNLGIVLQDLGRLREAEVSCRRATLISPDYAEAYNNLGNIVKDRGRINESETLYRLALQVNPGYAEAHNNLGNILQDLLRPNEVEACYRRALLVNPNYVTAHSNLLFALSYIRQNSRQYLEEAQRFGRLLTANATEPFTSWHSPEHSSRMRVGLLSGDLRQHPVCYFLQSLLEHIDPARIELFAYPTQLREDEFTTRIKPYFTAWKPLPGKNDEADAHLIHEDRIQVLIDLSGHTAYNRLPLFAWKPAPIQVSWLGYFASTGVNEIDYLIADPWTLPESEEVYFTEKILRLPETRLCFSAPDVKVPVSQLPALSNGYITFACFNNLVKINDAVVAVWAKILNTSPDSRLFLKTKQLKDFSVRRHVIERFAAHGVSADRLILEGPVSRADYFRTYHRTDITLDPFPYTGGTTSAESLWMGVPVLTLAGESFLSRQGVGLLMNAGLPEWIAADADDYVARALSHAGDVSRLALLRGELRQQVLASPLFDAERFARHFENALFSLTKRK
ncbi:MAG: tetratricopeptide repeat protein [Sterolibacterium sp.]